MALNRPGSTPTASNTSRGFDWRKYALAMFDNNREEKISSFDFQIRIHVPESLSFRSPGSHSDFHCMASTRAMVWNEGQRSIAYAAVSCLHRFLCVWTEAQGEWESLWCFFLIRNFEKTQQIVDALREYRGYLWGIFSIMFVTACLGMGLTELVTFENSII